MYTPNQSRATVSRLPSPKHCPNRFLKETIISLFLFFIVCHIQEVLHIQDASRVV
jgi:glycerol uptake facilitator-like aquaporin